MILPVLALTSTDYPAARHDDAAADGRDALLLGGGHSHFARRAGHFR